MQFFDLVQDAFEQESARREKIREQVKDIEKSCRHISALLMLAHRPDFNFNQVQSQILPLLGSIRDGFHTISKNIPADQFYRYNAQFSWSIQQSCFLVAFLTYLQFERLVTLEEIESCLGLKVNISNDLTDFHIPLEDFLHGVVSLTAELSRLATNSATAGLFERPLKIRDFVQDLYSGFQLLNLKNDSLRKRFDSIKV